MGFRTDLQGKASLLAEKILEKFGDTVAYSQKGAGAVTLDALPMAMTRESAEELGLRAEVTGRRFLIPRQTGWPPTSGPNIGDKITHDTVDYQVVRASVDSVETIWTLDTRKFRADKVE